MYLDAQQLDLLPKHYKALEKGKTISLPAKSLGVGRDVMLSKEQAKKIAKAITKGSGVRLSMTPDQVELHKGAGLWSEIKELIKENKKMIIEQGVPAFTTAIASATSANPAISTAFLAMTPGMQMAVEDIINQYIEDRDPSTLKERLQMLKKYLTSKQIKELTKMIVGLGKLKAVKAVEGLVGKGVRGRPRTRAIKPVMGHESAETVLVQKGEIDPIIESRDSAIEYKGGKITLKDVGKALRKVGEKVIGKKATKKVEQFGEKAGKYITAKKGGLASDIIDYGVPAATGAIVGGITGLATGPVGGVVGSAAGSKLGKEVIAPELRKLTGAGMMRGAGHCGMPADMCGCGVGGALMPAGTDSLPHGKVGMGLMPAGMGLKPAGAGMYMPAGRTIVRHGKSVSPKVMVPRKVSVSGGALMPHSSSAGTGNYIPLMVDTPAFYTPMM